MNKILVIDDEIEMCEMISEILKSAHFTVIISNGGKEGLELAKKDPPELIICDINMPNFNGFEVLTSIRNSEKLRSIPFIFLTGKTERENFRKGMNLSADDYLTKPFRAVELLEAVNARFIRKKQILLAELNQMKNLEWNMVNFLDGGSSLKIQDLEQLVEKLRKEIVESKSKIQNFSFITSHLLRGSIVNILSSLEFVREKPESYEQALKNIGESTKSLDKLTFELNDLLKENEKNELNIRTLHSVKPIKTILLVDDDEISLMFSKHLLKNINPDFDVIEMINPVEASDLIVKNDFRPDKIFLDIFMPEMDGWQFLTILEKNSIQLDITILSSSIDSDDIQKAKQFESVTSYLSKPITKEKITKVLRV